MVSLAMGVATFFALDWLTLKKLERYGEQEIVDILRGKNMNEEKNIEMTVTTVNKEIKVWP